MSWDAVVLAGGRARRLGGTDKLSVEVGGRRLLDRVLAAVGAADRIVVVGPRRVLAGPLADAVTWTREQPAGGGPVAGLAAGLPLVGADRVVLLAGDLPFVAPTLLDALLATLDGGAGAGGATGGMMDGVLLADGEGVPQPLCGAWRTEALRTALARLASPAGTSMRRLIAGLRLRTVPAPLGGPPPWLDCDTPDDVAAANELA